MDEIDIRMCQLLSMGPRMAYRDLADQLGISVSAVHARLRALMEEGVVKGFYARVSVGQLGGVVILISGRSTHTSSKDLFAALSLGDTVEEVFVASGMVVYINGVLHNISELDKHVEFVRKAAKLSNMRVGIESYGPYGDKKATRGVYEGEMTPLDYRIAESMATDARKPIQDIASEVNVSPRTVKRRLDRMVEQRLPEMSIIWDPYQVASLIITFVDIELEEGTDRDVFASDIAKKFGPKVLVTGMYHNLPTYAISMVWTSIIGDVRDIVDELEKDQRVVSAIPNVGIISTGLTSWRKEAMVKKGKR